MKFTKQNFDEIITYKLEENEPISKDEIVEHRKYSINVASLDEEDAIRYGEFLKQSFLEFRNSLRSKKMYCKYCNWEGTNGDISDYISKNNISQITICPKCNEVFGIYS